MNAKTKKRLLEKHRMAARNYACALDLLPRVLSKERRSLYAFVEERLMRAYNREVDAGILVVLGVNTEQAAQ